MKILKRIGVLAALAAMWAPLYLYGSTTTMDGPMTDTNAANGQAYAKQFKLNTTDHGIDYISAQVIFSSGAYSQGTFNDGTASSFTITVVTPASLSTATASAMVFITSNTALVGQTLFIAGVNLPFNVDLITSSNTACNMAASIATFTSFLSTCALNNATGIIYSTAPATGSKYNRYSMQSSSITAISSAAFAGGQDNACITVNGQSLCANRDWFPTAAAASTADSLYASINSSMSAILVSTDTGASGVVYATSTAVGTAANYLVSSSSQTVLQISGAGLVTTGAGVATGSMTGGTAATYVFKGQNVTIANHGYTNGLKTSVIMPATALYYSTATSGGTQTALTNGTTVYPIVVDANTIQLSLTSTGAIAGINSGNAITWVSSQAKTTADTFTVNVATAAGASSYGWFGSNDGTNFFQMPGVSTTTIAGGDSFIFPSTFTFTDFGVFDYKWLMLNVSPPATSGAIKIQAIMHGEQR